MCMKRKSNGCIIPGELLYPLEQEDLETLVEHWREGDLTARDSIIKHNMRLIVTMARTMASQRGCTHIIDELISVGLLELCQSVHRFARVSTDNNIIPYVRSCVRFRMHDCTCRLSVMRISERTLRHKAANGTFHELDIPANVNDEEGEEDASEVDIEPKKWERLTIDMSFNKIEFDEIVALSAETEEEKFILNMVRHGHTDREIADMIGRCNTYVFDRRHKVFNRFRYHWSE